MIRNSEAEQLAISIGADKVEDCLYTRAMDLCIFHIENVEIKLTNTEIYAILALGIKYFSEVFVNQLKESELYPIDAYNVLIGLCNYVAFYEKVYGVKTDLDLLKTVIDFNKDKTSFSIYLPNILGIKKDIRLKSAFVTHGNMLSAFN